MPNFGFCTKTDVKARMGISGTSFDTILDELCLSIAGVIERIAGRPLRQEAITDEYHSGGSKIILARIAPIKTSATVTIRESASYDWTTAGEYEELTANEDFIYRPGEKPGESGILIRLNREWMGSESRPGQIKLAYTGGYAAADAEHPIPDDLKGASIAQVAYEIERRKNPGRLMSTQRGVSIASGVSSQYNELNLLPETKSVALSYRRPAIS